jgi:hypothetical protein
MQFSSILLVPCLTTPGYPITGKHKINNKNYIEQNIKKYMRINKSKRFANMPKQNTALLNMSMFSQTTLAAEIYLVEGLALKLR